MKPQGPTTHRPTRLLSAALALAGLIAAPARALEINLGNAAPYAALVFEDLSGLLKSEGRVAVGGNLTLGSATLGAGTPNLAGTPALVVRGNIVSFAGGALWSGSSPGYGLYAGTKSANTAAALDLRQASLLPLDIEAERVQLSVLSEQLRDLPSTGTASLSPAQLTLTGSNASTEVFALAADQLAGSQRVVLANVAPDAHIVINLRANAQRRISVGLDTLALAGWKGRVLFNAHDAETVQFAGQTLWGGLLATNACVCNSTGRLEGIVVARKWSAAMEIAYTPFVPKP